MEYRHVMCMLLIGTVTIAKTNMAENKIHIGVLVPRLIRDEFCFRSAIKIAAEQIDLDKNILPNHTIEIHYYETFVSNIFIQNPSLSQFSSVFV